MADEDAHTDARFLSLTLRPDFDDVRARWAAFWEGEVVGRPVVVVTAPRGQQGEGRVDPPPYPAGMEGDFQPIIRRQLAYAKSTFWGGEAVPCYVPSFGPNQVAFFLGAGVESSPDSANTNWAVPFAGGWEEVLPLGLNPLNRLWTRMLRFVEALADAFAGKMLVGHIDLHSNMDCLAAFRSPQRLCEDLYDAPEQVQQALLDVRAVYPVMYDAIFRAGRMEEWGSIGWSPLYCAGKMNVVQCDFSCMVSPSMFRRFILPAIEEEIGFLDRSVYHLDGPGAVAHLDDLLSIARLDVIQWIPGEGRGPMTAWLQLLQRIQGAGKGLEVRCSVDEVKWLHRHLRPERVAYVCSARSEAEGRELLQWLGRNT